MADAYAKIVAVRGEASRETIIDWIVELAKSGETDANRIAKLILDSTPRLGPPQLAVSDSVRRKRSRPIAPHDSHAASNSGGLRRHCT